jgi:hypothetical protein
VDTELTKALFGGEPAGQPDKTPAPEQAPTVTSEAKEPQPRYLTVEEFNRALDEREAKRKRDEQSMADRIRNQTQKGLEKLLKAAQAAGITYSPEQVEGLRNGVAQQVQNEITQPEQTSPDQAGQPKPDAAAQAPKPPTSDWRTETRDKLYAKHGIQLEPGDPEVSTLTDANQVDLILSLDAALKAKSERLARSAGRVPFVPASGDPTNPLAGITDPQELWRRAREKVYKGS